MSPTLEALESRLKQYGPLRIKGSIHIMVIAGKRNGIGPRLESLSLPTSSAWL
jgi:hypothetical protein